MKKRKQVILPGKIELVEKQILDENSKKTYVIANVRECGLDYMLHKNHIKEYQHKSGIRFRQTFERASIGGPKGRNYELIVKTDNRNLSTFTLSAIFELRNINEVLGNKGFNIACYICGQDYSLRQTRNIMNIKKVYMGERLREVLDDLAKYYGYYQKKY
tara:strand:- start:118 stop:597 length:480 start_codon:yes stop_codon:yes gene_type:complete